MVFTDPPYNINYKSISPRRPLSRKEIKRRKEPNSYSSGKYGKSKKVFNDNKTEEEYLQFLKDSMANCYKVGKEKMVAFLWSGDKNFDIAIRSCKETNWGINQLAVWVKNRFVFNPSCIFHKILEYCVIAFKDGHRPTVNKSYAKYHHNLIDLEFDSFTEHLETFYAKRDNISKYDHPTQKPIRLAEPAIKACSERDDIVLDLFGGSGSTLIACEQLDRRCYMMELDPKYCDVIIKRWERFTKQKIITVK